jgi:uncharacterized membrane protein (DUF2068 family)
MSLFGNKRNGLVAVVMLSLIQSLLRFVVFAVALNGEWTNMEHFVSPEEGAIMDAIFLFLGVGGIVLSYGLFTGKKWGYTGTIGISAFTIVFDVWAIFAVQPSALLGIVLPVVFIVYLVLIRNDFRTEVRSNGCIGGLRN